MTKTELRQIAKNHPITGYMDYRSWLNAIYSEAKSRDKSYSYAKLSSDLNLGSSNAHLIISGKRELTSRTGSHVISALRLTGKDKRYLEKLISYERAKDAVTRDEAFSDLMALKTKSLANELGRNQLAFFSNWYNAAILELLRLPGAQDDPEWISRSLSPRVSVPNVKKALSLLKELGYVADKRGRLQPTDATVSTGDEAYGMAVTSFHQQMIELAKQAIDSCPPEEREISAVTLALPAAVRQQVKDEIVAFRKKLIKLANSTDSQEEIVQVNFQMFSLGGTNGDDK